MSSSPQEPQTKIKRKRASQACDFCAKRGIKCAPSTENPSKCQSCVHYDEPCTYDRPKKKRGGRSHSNPSAAKQKQATDLTASSIHLLRAEDFEAIEPPELSFAWKSFAIAADEKIRNLVDIFFELVHPILPIFHYETLSERVNDRLHLRDRGLFASVMAVCSLAATRVRNGTGPQEWEHTEPAAETFFEAARQAIPKELVRAQSIHYLRATALLAITGVQLSQISEFRQWIGLYHGICALEGFHNEKHWPKCNAVEMEERRCIFWAIYKFDIFASIVWGCIPRNRESQVQVKYPSWMDSESVPGFPHSTGISWLRGWNFTTDLYRILEHALDCYRVSQVQVKPELALYVHRPSLSAILSQVDKMYSSLPKDLKSLDHDSNSTKKALGFQSVNILATLAMVRLIIFSSEGKQTTSQKCEVAEELLSQFQDCPDLYLKAVSSPLMQLLGGIGSILESTYKEVYPEAGYQRVRQALLDLVLLLERIESDTKENQMSRRVQDRVQHLDEFAQAEMQKTAHKPQPTRGRVDIQTRGKKATKLSALSTVATSATASELGQGDIQKSATSAGASVFEAGASPGQLAAEQNLMDALNWQWPDSLLEWPWSFTADFDPNYIPPSAK